MWAAQKHLDTHDILFEPGLNEELAATAIRGTQQLAWFGPSPWQGVFGLWYGKGLVVDRAHEALKLGNMEGSAATGGFLVWPAMRPWRQIFRHCASIRACPHRQPDPDTLSRDNPGDAGIWHLRMGDVRDTSGACVGLKCITDTLDLTTSVDLPRCASRLRPAPGRLLPPEGLNLIKGAMPLKMEQMLVEHRLPQPRPLHGSTTIDQVVIDGERRELGIIAAGKAYLDLRRGNG